MPEAVDRAGLRQALRVFADRLSWRGLPWAVGGSVLLYAHGLIDEVNDLDLLVPGDAGTTVRGALGPYLKEFSTAGTDLWRSGFLARLQLGAWPVDLIGGLAVAHGEGVYHLPFGAGSPVFTWDLDGLPVPLLPLAEFYLIYLLYPEKAWKAALIEQYLLQTGSEADLLEAALERPGLPAFAKARVRHLLNCN